MATLRVGLVQLNSQHDRAANLAAIEALVAEAAGRGARFVMLPEHAPYLGPQAGYQAGAEPIPGPTSERLARIKSGAVDPDSDAPRLVGMPKVDCLVDGTLRRDAILRTSYGGRGRSRLAAA